MRIVGAEVDGDPHLRLAGLDRGQMVERAETAAARAIVDAARVLEAPEPRRRVVLQVFERGTEFVRYSGFTRQVSVSDGP